MPVPYLHELHYRIELTAVLVAETNIVWVALVYRKGNNSKSWTSAPRNSPEAAAYLAKRWLQGKPDVREKRHA